MPGASAENVLELNYLGMKEPAGGWTQKKRVKRGWREFGQEVVKESAAWVQCGHCLRCYCQPPGISLELQ